MKAVLLYKEDYPHFATWVCMEVDGEKRHILFRGNHTEADISCDGKCNRPEIDVPENVVKLVRKGIEMRASEAALRSHAAQ